MADMVNATVIVCSVFQVICLVVAITWSYVAPSCRRAQRRTRHNAVFALGMQVLQLLVLGLWMWAKEEGQVSQYSILISLAVLCTVLLSLIYFVVQVSRFQKECRGCCEERPHCPDSRE